MGLATCLEWHARSRLVDLTIFRPSAIHTADVKRIADQALSEMMVSGVALPHLLGAAASVNSLSQYIAIFKRLFDELGRDLSLERQLCQEKDAGGEAIYERLEYLFTLRHELVHEIHYGQVGHMNFSSRWTLTEAKGFADAVVCCIQAVEKLIALHTPRDFPNRLSDDFAPEDESEKLMAAICQLEKEISDSLAEDDNGAKNWKLALEAQKAALQSEIEFIDTAIALRPLRYLDVRAEMKAELLKSRLRFLLALKVETSAFNDPS